MDSKPCVQMKYGDKTSKFTPKRDNEDNFFLQMIKIASGQCAQLFCVSSIFACIMNVMHEQDQLTS